jgi:hypothetical protein
MKRALPILMCLAALAAGCQTEDPTATTTIPTTPTNPTVQTFSGTVQVKGRDIKPFSVALSGGTLTVALTSASPSIAMGVGVGLWDGTTCSLLTNGSQTTLPRPDPILQGTVNGGDYCLQVFDAGSQTVAVTYTATVTHY